MEEKQEFWNELRKIVCSVGIEPLSMMGDFNSIRQESERSGSMHIFNFIFGRFGILYVSNFSFTWFGPLDRKSKLDRVIVNKKWLATSSWRVDGWNRRNSDHIPISLSCDKSNWGPKPFKVFNEWLKLSEVQDIMYRAVTDKKQNSWFGLLKELKLSLKQWSRDSSNNTESCIVELENKMKDLDNSQAPFEEKTKVFEQLQHAYHREMLQFKQKIQSLMGP